MEQELERQSVLITGLITEMSAHTLILKALIRKTGLSNSDVLNELNMPQHAELSALLQRNLERGMIISAINDIIP